MSRPKHPGMYPTFSMALHAADLEKQRKQWIIDAINYITAIEQERDEAVRILDDVCETFGHADSLCVDEAAEFLASIEGDDNDRA